MRAPPLRTWFFLAALGAASCPRDLPPIPTISRIDPVAVRGLDSTTLRLIGGPFTVRIHADLDAPGLSQPEGAFKASLRSGDLVVPLGDVQWVSSTELAGVVPALTPVGTYDVQAVDAWGRLALLPQSFTVAVECLDASDCDDHLSCTDDSCEGYHCQHALQASACVIDGVCRAQGEVAPGNACLACSPPDSPSAWTPVVNGTPCDDGDACTLGETCQAGTCGSPLATKACPATACRASHCDPLTGECDGAELTGSCDDGYDCTAGDQCVAGECRGTPVCGNTAPNACLQVSPKATVAGASPAQVTLDPRCSSDLEDAASALQARFDLDGDGAFDTPFGPLAPAVATFATPGLYRVGVEIADSGGLRASAQTYVSVAAPAYDVLVTTNADERDDGGTPAAPGGTGLSLREAISYVNASGKTGMAIRFVSPMSIQAVALPALSAPGARIVAEPGVVVDFTAASGGLAGCLVLNGAAEALIGLDAKRCPMAALSIGGSNALVAETRLHDGNANGAEINGDHATIGPGVDVESFGGFGLLMKKTGIVVTGSTISRNASDGIEVWQNSTDALLLRNLVTANGGAGVNVKANQGGPRAWNNTIAGNGGNGISGASGTSARNNLLTGNSGFALCGTAGAFTDQDPNGVYGNGGTYCMGPPGAGSNQLDAGYLAPDRGDFRLRPDSPDLNAGAVLPDAGYSGTLPDFGAFESPY